MKHDAHKLVEQFRHYWQQHWLLRWVIANMLGWSLGLLASTLTIWLFGGIGALLSGATLGIGISSPQAWILFPSDDMPSRRKWILYSATAGFFAIFPVLILSLLAIFNLWMAALLVGIVFSALLGLLQSFVLVPLVDDSAYLWIPICILAGSIATLLSVPILMTPIPLICSPASIPFALITGWLMLRYMHNTENISEN